MVWLQGTPSILPGLPSWCNWGFVIFVAYSAYYLFIAGPVVGGLVDVLYTLLYLAAKCFVDRYTMPSKEIENGKPQTSSAKFVWQISLLTNVIGWYLQIHPGHAIFEGRKPALLDSFGQSLVLAPLFVFYELFFWMGFLPDVRDQVTAAIAVTQASWVTPAPSL